MKKALEILNRIKEGTFINGHISELKSIEEAIAELEELQKSTNMAIKEIEYALAKSQYADVYLNNAIRFLKDNV